LPFQLGLNIKDILEVVSDFDRRKNFINVVHLLKLLHRVEHRMLPRVKVSYRIEMGLSFLKLSIFCQKGATSILGHSRCCLILRFLLFWLCFAHFFIFFGYVVCEELFVFVLFYHHFLVVTQCVFWLILALLEDFVKSVAHLNSS
jgi:hypothetical protein